MYCIRSCPKRCCYIQTRLSFVLLWGYTGQSGTSTDVLNTNREVKPSMHMKFQ